MDKTPFSVREGFVEIPKRPISDLNEETRMGLYNALFSEFLDGEVYHYCVMNSHVVNEPLATFAKKIWSEFFSMPLDQWHGFIPDLSSSIKRLMIGNDNHHFFTVIDFIEYVLNNYEPIHENSEEFEKKINNVLIKNNSVYRVINQQFGKLSQEEEVKEVSKASKSILETVNIHLKKSMNLMSQEKPDFANSIAESIKAVESICEKIVGDPNATLGQALKIIEKERQIELPTPLKSSFDKLYGWSSSDQGIRHAFSTIPKEEVDIEEARFMLVSCSAFVNYLIDESIKSKIKLID